METVGRWASFILGTLGMRGGIMYVLHVDSFMRIAATDELNWFFVLLKNQRDLKRYVLGLVGSK